jgi:hypothetical protein
VISDVRDSGRLLFEFNKLVYEPDPNLTGVS